MRKICVLLLFMTVSMSFGQSPDQMKKINYFVDVAQQEFNLNKKQTKGLLKARTAYMINYQKVSDAERTGEISEKEKKVQLNIINSSFSNYFSELVGKSTDELNYFYVSIRNEMKRL